MFIYPIESAYIMKYLRKRLTELNSERSLNADRGLINDPALDAQIQDVEELRASLTRGQERYFHFSIYISIYSETEEQIKKLSNTLDTLFWTKYTHKTGFSPFWTRICRNGTICPWWGRCLPKYLDKRTFNYISIHFKFSFPGRWNPCWINTHNNSLIIFDRFRTENANMVVFAKSGWGKSFAVKLEILRSLLDARNRCYRSWSRKWIQDTRRHSWWNVCQYQPLIPMNESIHLICLALWKIPRQNQGICSVVRS